MNYTKGCEGMQYRLSVRELVEFLFQSGDLVYSGQSVERANLGSRIHRMLQSQATGDYQSEVYLKQETIIEDVTFVIDGRADGILKDEHGITIEEIKTTALPHDEINDSCFVHGAQAYCYGYLYAMQHACEQLTIQLTYYQIETKHIFTFQQVKTQEQLTAFYLDCLKQHLRWARLSQNIRIASSTTLKKLTFPFSSYRKGQRQFAVAVYKTILDKQNLFAQAPTGIGKTISTIFPSLKAIGEGKAEKLFYLCAKNITASVAYDTIALLQKQDVSFKTVCITAKDKICLLEERNCDPKVCPYAKGYYDRNKNALYELLSGEDFMNKEVIVQMAKQHDICPFELSLDASLYADVIICDYNYVFDPHVYLKRFFMEKGNYIFLVDEAHNLIDRGREMYSAVLEKEQFLSIRKKIPKDAVLLHKALQAVLSEFAKLKKCCEYSDFFADEEPCLPFLEKLESFFEHCDAYLQSEHEESHDDELKDVYFAVNAYIRIADYYDEHFVTLIQKDANNVIVKQFCMNPRHPLQNIMKKGRSTILFSATLSPIDYYLELLGGDEMTPRLSLPSPFAKQQIKVIINNAISTKYRNRSHSLIAIVEMIHACVLAKAGNYIVFCPSYAYLQQIAEEFANQYPDIAISIQDGNMNDEQKQAYLKQFEEMDGLHVAFCVLGGMFAEGIDLKGDRLIGAIIIGVGLPKLHPQLDLIKAHFDEINQMGYAYAYQFPGMNKVLQAAGRVIRSLSDKGMVAFIDERFTTRFYLNLLPIQYAHYEIINEPQRVYTVLSSFWQE